MSKKRKKRKRKLKIKNILIFLFVILFLGSVGYYIIMSPIKNIYIEGNNILTDEIIIEEAKIDSYPSFLLTSSFKLKRNLKNNKYIKKVRIKKKLGNILEIKIDEYSTIVSLDNNTRLMLSNGDIVDNVYNVTDLAVLNNQIPKEKVNLFARKFAKINRDILRQISQIDYQPVKVDSERFLLYMDDGNLVYITLTKIDKLNKYNKIKGKIVGKTGVIYLDSGDYIELKDNKSVLKKEEDNKENEEH